MDLALFTSRFIRARRSLLRCTHLLFLPTAYDRKKGINWLHESRIQRRAGSKRKLQTRNASAVSGSEETDRQSEEAAQKGYLPQKGEG